MAVATPETETLRLDVEGMTCASCAARIERKLNKLDGVEATVNYATEAASVSFDPASVSVDDLIATVEAIGYHAALPRDVVETPDAARAVRTRLVVAAVLTAPLVAITMVSPFQFEGWEWVALVLATPVVFWAGAAFHRATLLNARHGAATMDTLISVGTLAAWTWSTVVLVGGIDAHTYFEVAAVITTLILLGRWLELRARGRSGEAIRSCSSSARERHACFAAAMRCSCPWSSSRSATCSPSGRGRRSRPTASSSRARPPSTSRC